MAETVNDVAFLGSYKNEFGVVFSHLVLKALLMQNNLRSNVPKQNLPGKVYFISSRNTVRRDTRFEFVTVDEEDVMRLQLSAKTTAASLGFQEGATLAMPIVKQTIQRCSIYYGIIFYSVDDAFEVASKFETVNSSKSFYIHHYSCFCLFFSVFPRRIFSLHPSFRS